MKLLIPLSLFLLPVLLSAQADNKPIDFNPPGEEIKSKPFNGYISLNFNLNNFASPSFYFGGSISLLITPNIPIGLTGNFRIGYLTTYDSLPVGISSITIGTAYIGVFSGYRFFANSPIGFSVLGTIAYGGIHYSYKDNMGNASSSQIDGRMILIPEVSLDYRPVQFLEISLGMKYLIFMGSESELNIRQGELSGFSPFLCVKFNPF